jgi:hypothetical protein
LFSHIPIANEKFIKAIFGKHQNKRKITLPNCFLEVLTTDKIEREITQEVNVHGRVGMLDLFGC